LGLAFCPLLWVALGMIAVPVVLAIVAAIQAPMPRHRHWMTRPLTASLHWRQPIARGWARYSVRRKHKVMNSEAAGFKRPHDLPFDPREKRTLRYWSHDQDRIPLLRQIIAEATQAGWR